MKKVALCGNPNVGKSTLFNALTGLKQHTGNWAGKTVEISLGRYFHNGTEYMLADLPGTYSYSSHSREEEIAGDFIKNKNADVFVVICDGMCMERNLHIVLRTLELSGNVVVAVNMIDEAEKKNISIDAAMLEKELGVSVVPVSARSGRGLEELKDAIAKAFESTEEAEYPKEYAGIEKIYERAKDICLKCVSEDGGTKKLGSADRLLTNKYIGIPIMLAGFALILFITVSGANYPSQWLSELLLGLEDDILTAVRFIGLPDWLCLMLVSGGYRVLAWVVSVMLPPMAIFFPLFTILEDWGFLPRIAFNLDGAFKRCNACGKQALTMCMGLGCNAVGVTGCRIIDSKRERIIAILTNSFMPCNGRFPILISVISMFFVGGTGVGDYLSASLLLMLFILFAVMMTLLVSRLLSKTVLRGMPSLFTLELPPYRRPQFKKVLVRCVLDRILKVLARAAAVAFPTGAVLYAAANITVGGMSVFEHISDFLSPFAGIMGLDGVILLAFILALPANEIVMPIVIMGYLAAGTISALPDTAMLREVLISNGWTVKTALCMLTFTLFHWPCSTTLLTVKKETGSVLWTAFAGILPTAVGILLCIAFSLLVTV